VTGRLDIRRSARLLPEAANVYAQFPKADGDAIGGEALRDSLQAMAIVESRLNVGPEASNLGCLRRRLFLAQRREAGSGVVPHNVTLRRRSTEVNKSQQSTTRSTVVNKVQQFGAAVSDGQGVSGRDQAVEEHKGTRYAAAVFLVISLILLRLPRIAFSRQRIRRVIRHRFRLGTVPKRLRAALSN
jgi:hypothetical protein